MSNYPPPDNDDSNMPMPRYHQHYNNNIGSQQNNDYSNHHYQQPLHHQANNRENIGWNNDNYRPPNNNNIMSDNKKFNHYSQNDMHNNYNNGPPNSQRHDNYNNHRGDGGNHNNNNNNATIIKKRAAKRRVKHDLPGPAGNWFRQKKAAVANRKQSSAAAATANSSAMKTDETKKQQSNSGNAMAKLEDNGEQSADSKLIISSSSPPSPSNNNPKTKRQDEQLFHDHSSDLHECNAWNLMCTTLNRIVPPANLLRHNHNHHPNAAYTTYKATLRKCIPDNYALMHEIHEGRYDTCHLDQHLYATDLRVPLLVGYVASVQCHAHSDWTALLVDEMQSVAKYHGGNGSSNNAGRGVLCWIEERLVKQHANWIRPGAVWMIEGAKLALFSSLEEEEEEEDGDDGEHGSNNNHGGSNASMSTATVDVSPSTDNSRGGCAIDRMILVGESSLVYAWTPEEASSTFTHEEFSDLMERRCDLGLQGEELPDDEVEEKDVTICDVDCTSSKSDVKKKNDIDIDADYDDVNDVLIVEKTNAQTDEIVDVDASNEEASAALEQVLEACSAANDKPMQIESQTEDAMPIPQVVEGEPKDDPQPPVKNLPNPYAKKTLSQVTPHEESTTTSLDAGNVPRDDDAMNSSVLVQPKESSASPANDKGIDDNTEKKCSALDTAQSPLINRPDQQMQVDIDDSFDDMLDEDSLEALPPNDEGKPRNITNTSMSKGDVSFDDMLDEESLDITPLKNEDSSAGKLDSSKMNTPGGDSFDDMLDDDSLDIDTPNIGKLGPKTNNTPGGDSFDDMLDEDSDDNIEAMFQIKTTSDNLFSGVTVLDQDDLADLGDEDDDDF